MQRKIRFGLIICCLYVFINAFFIFRTVNDYEIFALPMAEELNEAEKTNEEIQNKLNEVKEKKKQLNQTKNNIAGELAWLNQRSEEQKELVQEKLKNKEDAIDQMDLAIELYFQSEKNHQEKKAQYKERLTAMYHYRQKSMLALFLEADSLRGFFVNQKFMGIIATTDEQIIDELQATLSDMEMKKGIAETAVTNMEKVINQVEQDLGEIEKNEQAKREDFRDVSKEVEEALKEEGDLSNEANEVASLIQTLERERVAKEVEEQQRAAKELEEQQKAAKALEEQKRAAQELEEQKKQQQNEAGEQPEAAAKTPEEADLEPQSPEQQPEPNQPEATQPSSSSSWTWPVPARHTITSHFGQRWGRAHNGIDIGGGADGYGLKIVASRSGKVVRVQNPVEGQNTGGSGYGNNILIDHGDGFATLYAHLKNTKVTYGEEVAAGQLIGDMGSTGNSTGAHLHFEVWVKGAPQNPTNYVS